MKSAYIETSIVSYLAGRTSRNRLVAAHQQATRNWWIRRRKGYDLYTSELVIAESKLGDPTVAKRRLRYLKGIRELPVTDKVRNLAEELVRKGALPEKAGADALHIATASVHGTDLLVTWNCRHINNPITKPMVRLVCRQSGYACPEICTPVELLERVNDEE
jgi:predicted nucleic acid-binding protein